jgi:hypothetical protein
MQKHERSHPLYLGLAGANLRNFYDDGVWHRRILFHARIIRSRLLGFWEVGQQRKTWEKSLEKIGLR